jgi:FKBP-type peptidyl-prolyl cis-trans isomerase (trigger factor)
MTDEEPIELTDEELEAEIEKIAAVIPSVIREYAELLRLLA